MFSPDLPLSVLFSSLSKLQCDKQRLFGKLESEKLTEKENKKRRRYGPNQGPNSHRTKACCTIMAVMAFFTFIMKLFNILVSVQSLDECNQVQASWKRFQPSKFQFVLGLMDSPLNGISVNIVLLLWEETFICYLAHTHIGNHAHRRQVSLLIPRYRNATEATKCVSNSNLLFEVIFSFLSRSNWSDTEITADSGRERDGFKDWQRPDDRLTSGKPFEIHSFKITFYFICAQNC